MSQATTTAQLKHFFSSITDGTHFSPPTIESGGMAYVTVRDIDAGRVNIESAARICEADFTRLERQGCRPGVGDLLFSKDGTIGKVALCDRDDFVVLSSLALMRPKTSMEPRFLKYLLLSADLLNQVESHMAGAALRRITLDKIVRLRASAPADANEQRRIANFLDEQTTRIDALIAEKEELLRQIAGYLDSQMSFLLSGGSIGGNRKKTGWRFLEEIPAHWSLCHLRWIAERVDVGIAEAATHAYADEGVPILRSTNIRANRIEGSLLRVEPWFAERNVSKTLYANDLVTVRTGYPGVTAVVPQDLNGCQCFTMLITTLQDGYLPEFYARYLNAAPARAYFEVESWGSAQKNISVPILKDVYVPRLPIEEQLSLAAECRSVEKAFGDLIIHVTAHVDRLREYRSSLISAAVTGQLDLGVGSTWDEQRLAA